MNMITEVDSGLKGTEPRPTGSNIKLQRTTAYKIKTNHPDIHLNMVVVPAIKGQMIARFRVLITTVEKITGFKIDVEETATYEDAITALKSGAAHIAWLGAKSFLDGTSEADIEAFAVAVRGKGQRSTYRTFFLTHADSEIETVADMKGMCLMLTEPGSTSGDLVPRHELCKYALDPENPSNFRMISYSGSQEASITAALSDKDVVAAISEINYENFIAKNSHDKGKLKIIHTSSEIPGAPLVYSKRLPVDIRTRLKEAVINAHKYGTVSGYGEDIVNYESHEQARSDFFNSYLRPQWGWRTFTFIGAFVLITLFINFHLEIKPLEAFANSSKYLMDLMGRLFPPDFSNVGNLIVAMIETIEIGILGTILASLLAVPVGLFSARNIASNVTIYHIAKSITIFFRAIPEFIMAMFLVIAVGFGALPGVLALGFHTMGFLAKFFSEEIEHVSTGPIEALTATGADRYHILMFAIVPQIVPSLVGFTLYILDRNIRMATMLGIVGAGGIGYRLQSAFRMFQYREVTAIIIIIFLTIYIIDIISSKLRFSVK